MDSAPSAIRGYNYDRPKQDDRFKQLSESEAPTLLNNDGMISNYDKKFLSYLVNMHNSLRGDRIDVDRINSLNEMLQHMKGEQSEEYLETLLHPETVKGTKIPSTIPVPSSSFQLHNSITVAPNALGHFAIVFNPFFLSGAGTNSSLWLNNNVGLTGSASSNFFTAVNVGETIPPVYNQYRLVSASIVIKYVGRLDIVQGVLGGAIIFDQNVNTGDYTVPAINANLAKYGDFNLAMDSYYTQENLTLNGLRELYFPLDVTFEEYTDIGTSKNGFAYVAYCYSGVPSTPSYKVDVYMNFECLADATFLNYIPASPCMIGTDRKSEAIQIVQQNPITDESESRIRRNASSFWDKLKNNLGSILPSVASIASAFFPSLKSVMPVIQAGSQMLQTPNQYEMAPGPISNQGYSNLNFAPENKYNADRKSVV